MKKYLIYFIVVGIVYLSVIYLISINIGLPPFRKGFIIGYPTMYYQFDMSDGTTQHGRTSFLNVIYNFIIVSSVAFILYKIKSRNNSNVPN